MPIYEFRCKACGEMFQELFSSTTVDMASLSCPKCHRTNAEKILSVFATDAKSSQSSATGGTSCGPGCGCHHG